MMKRRQYRVVGEVFRQQTLKKNNKSFVQLQQWKHRIIYLIENVYLHLPFKNNNQYKIQLTIKCIKLYEHLIPSYVKH